MSEGSRFAQAVIMAMGAALLVFVVPLAMWFVAVGVFRSEFGAMFSLLLGVPLGLLLSCYGIFLSFRYYRKAKMGVS